MDSSEKRGKSGEGESSWPSQQLLDDTAQAWGAITNRPVSEEDARRIVLGLASLFEVVGIASLDQGEAAS